MAHGEPRGRWDHDVEGGGGLFGVIIIVIMISIASALNFNKLQKYTSNVHQIQETAQNSLTSQAI